jgi:hypothetical protein
MADYMRKFISLDRDDDGKRIRSTVSVATLNNELRPNAETPLQLAFIKRSLERIETIALTTTDALVSTDECLLKSFVVNMMNLPRTNIDDPDRLLAFGDNEYIHPKYYQASRQILTDQMYTCHALFRSDIGDLVANNKKITVFPRETLETLSPGQQQQCYNMENLVSVDLLVNMGKGLNRYLACLTNITNRMDEKCTPVRGIPRVEIDAIYRMTLQELTNAAVIMKTTESAETK